MTFLEVHGICQCRHAWDSKCSDSKAALLLLEVLLPGPQQYATNNGLYGYYYGVGAITYFGGLGTYNLQLSQYLRVEQCLAEGLHAVVHELVKGLDSTWPPGMVGTGALLG